jgi:hypothetical protein
MAEGQGLRVVGAGLGRTGTHSLKVAFEQLFGGPCYHMLEVFGRPDQRAGWRSATRGEVIDWPEFLRGYVATVDWPAVGFWKEITAAAPDAMVVLSTRRDAQSWWKSAGDTIFAVCARGAPPDDPEGADELAMIIELLDRRFTPEWRDPEAAMAAYDAHNADVRASVPVDRLVEWQAGDGWEPLCTALGLPVPAEPFPHLNSTSDFRAMTGLDAVG